MSVSTSHAHDFVSASPTPAPGLSDTEPTDEWKRQIKERINTNLQKLYQDAEELYKRRLLDVRSDDERAHLKEDHKLEIGRIRALGAEEYHTQLELERQQRKWALGQPIDAKWKDALMREHRKIFESYKPPEPTPDIPDQNGPQSSRSNPPTTEVRSNLSQRSITVPEYHPPPLPPEIEQKKASQAREERPPPRVRRESDAVAGPAKEEYRHATYFPSAEDRGPHHGQWAPGLTEEPESFTYNHPNKSRPSADRSPTLERSEDDRPSTRASERPPRSGTERYTPSSPVKHEIWRPNVTAEEEAAGARRGLARRGSTASQRSVGSNSIRSLPTGPILERPDDHEHERKLENEPLSASLDKSKERQPQSRAFQIATEPTERWDDPPHPSSKVVPNSAPPGRSPSDRPPLGPYYPPQRSPSLKHPPHADDVDRAFPPPAYKSPRKHPSKSSFTTDSIDFRFGGTGPPLIDESIRERDYPYRSASTVHAQHRPIVPKPSFNGSTMNRDEDGRFVQDWYPSKRSLSRMGSLSRDREYREREPDDWTGGLRMRDRERDRDHHHQRGFFPPGPFTDDSYIGYRRQSPELTRPSLTRGASFATRSTTTPTTTTTPDDYDVGHHHPPTGYPGEGYQRSYTQSSPTSIPINRGKQPPPRSVTDDYGIASWRDWTKLTEGGRPPRPSPEPPRSTYEIYTPPSSYSAQAHPVHNFGGREANDHRRNDHVPESETERIRLRLEELTRLEREEAVKREEAERMVREKIEEIKMKEEEARRKVEEARKTEEEARRKSEVARKQEEEARRKQEEAKRWEEEAKRKEEEARRLEEELRRKEEEARRKEEDTRRKEEEVRRKEEEARVKEEEARIKEEGAIRKEEEARRKEDEVKKKELDARRREREAHKKEQEAKRKEQEAKRMEEEARRIEEEARRREEETERREEDLERREEEALKRAAEIRKKTEEIRRREEELKRREEELLRREAESRFEDEKMRLFEEEMERQREEEVRRQEEEEARRREEAKREEAARREDERRQRFDEDRRRREEEKRRREEERQQRLEAEMKVIEEERQRLAEEKKRREEEQQRLEEEKKRREEEMARRREEEERKKEQEAAAKRQQEEEKRRQEEWRKEQERIHEEVMRREWEKEKRRNESAHTMQQGAYDKQREEIQKRKGEERKQYGNGYDSGFMSSSPTATSSSPLSSGRPPNGPQRQGSVNASAWTSASAAGSAWKTSATSPSSPSTGSSTRSSTSSSTSATTAPSSSSIPTSSTPKPKPTGTSTSTNTSNNTNTHTESEWARRQAEQAKEQQERFRREQEREYQRRAANDVNKTLSEKDLNQLYQTHETRWKDLNTFDVLRWETFPWPMVRRPKSAEDIKESMIHAYLFAKACWPEKDSLKTDKDRLKEHIKRWHPDKFNTKYLPKVIEEDKERVKEGAGAVVRGLNAILTKMNEPQSAGLFG